MIRVRTGSRLHFGLFHLPPAEPWPPGVRYFGGLGMMIEEPAIEAISIPSVQWSAAGAIAERINGILQNLFANVDNLPPQRISVDHAPPFHAGLGSGTQIALAVTTAALSAAQMHWPIERLGQLLGRGRRSAIGIHGFVQGGFLVDAGKCRPDDIATIDSRIEFPDEWRIVLVRPKADNSWHGEKERDAFTELRTVPAPDLRPFAEKAVLPALAARDLAAFGAALTEFNARAGDVFAPLQGGRYASPATAAAVTRLLELGAAGAGQSSWGATAFGIIGDVDHANSAARLLSHEFPDVRVVTARNRGFATYAE